MVKNLPAVRETHVLSLGRKDPLEEETATHSSILAGESHGQRSLAGYSPWGHKESDTTEGPTSTHLGLRELRGWAELSIYPAQNSRPLGRGPQAAGALAQG